MPKSKQRVSRLFWPSAASRWFSGGCTASVVVDASGVPQKRRPDADRGSRLHDDAEKILREKKPGDLSDLDREIVEAYVEFIRARDGAKLYEFNADLVPGLCGGKSDAVILEPEPGVLEIVDLKTGTWFVDPTGNPQLAIYWSAVHEKLQHLGDFKRARMTIAQPAVNNFSSWDAPRHEVLEIGRAVEDVIWSVMDGEVEFKPSEDNCKFCDAKPICPAHLENVNRAARDDFRSKPDPNLARLSRTPAEEMTWAERLELVPLLRQWCAAVESTTSAMLLKGEEIEGFKVVEGRKGNRSWADPKKAKKLLESWGLDETEIFTEPVMVSPAQAEKLVKVSTKDDKDLASKRREALSEAWAEGKQGPPTVVPEHDRRSPINREDLAKRDFSEYIVEGSGGNLEED